MSSGDRVLGSDYVEAGLPRLVPIEVIDESSPGNVLSDPSRNVDFTKKDFWSKLYNMSREGFAQDGSKQKELASYILERFDIRRRGPFLDVGFGKNFAPSRVMAEAGVETYALDVRQDPKWYNLAISGSMGFSIGQFWHAPRFLESRDDIKIFYGDIEKIRYDGSALHGNRFGFVLFNGSYSSGEANNLTIDDGYGNLDKNDRKEKKRRLTLEACREAVLPGGLIGIVSSRYAYQGAGYFFEDYPLEKSNFFEIYRQLCKLGATKFYLIGMSPFAFDAAVERSKREVTVDQLRRERGEDTHLNILPQEMINSVTQKLLGMSFAQELAQFSPTPDAQEIMEAFDRLARIDAIFAEFQ